MERSISAMRMMRGLFLGFDAGELDLDWSVSSEKVDHDLDETFARIEFDDFSFTSFKWSIFYRDIVTYLHVSLVFFAFFCEYSLELV